MRLKSLLKLQVSYYLLGMLFNAGSYLSTSNDMQQWTPNDPVPSAFFMTLYALFGYGGVIKHISLIQETPELYCCSAAMIIGPGINVFGLVLNILGVSGKFLK